MCGPVSEWINCTPCLSQEVRVPVVRWKVNVEMEVEIVRCVGVEETVGDWIVKVRGLGGSGLLEEELGAGDEVVGGRPRGFYRGG